MERILIVYGRNKAIKYIHVRKAQVNQAVLRDV